MKTRAEKFSDLNARIRQLAVQRAAALEQGASKRLKANGAEFIRLRAMIAKLDPAQM